MTPRLVPNALCPECQASNCWTVVFDAMRVVCRSCGWGGVKDEARATWDNLQQASPPAADQWLTKIPHVACVQYARAFAAAKNERIAELERHCDTLEVAEAHAQGVAGKAIVRAEAAEAALRREWWNNHGCLLSSSYGDDGEMQCGQCTTDFRRMPFDQLEERVGTLRRKAAALAEKGNCPK